MSCKFAWICAPEVDSRTRWCCQIPGRSCKEKPNQAQHFSRGASCKSASPGNNHSHSVMFQSEENHNGSLLLSPATLTRTPSRSLASPPSWPRGPPWASGGLRRRNGSDEAGKAQQARRKCSTFDGIFYLRCGKGKVPVFDNRPHIPLKKIVENWPQFTMHCN